MQPDVTVIVPAFDSLAYVTRAVESVRAQTIGVEHLELIAIDDGSTDGTANELERLRTTFSAMRVLHQRNSGSPGSPRNRGLELARGRYVFFLDADDYLEDRALELMVAMADENSADIVLGRLESAGGRPVPRRMFTHDQPLTDVFSSQVYWALNAIKLFRREFIEREQLRFDEDLACGDDQPFVAAAYLATSRISVLASIPCAWCTWRDDGMNRSRVDAALDSRLALAERMFALVADRVPRGPDRDGLMVRHFHYEVWNHLAPALVAETDTVAIDAALSRLAEWTARYCTSGVRLQLPPLQRVGLELLDRGDLERVAVLLSDEHSLLQAPRVVEGERAFAAGRFFRDDDAALPDELFEITARVWVDRELSAVHWDRDDLVIEGCAALARLGHEGLAATVILRERASHAEFRAPALISRPPEHGRCQQAVFSAHVPVGHALETGALSRGVWNLHVELRLGDLVREARVGADRAESLTAHTGPHIVAAGAARHLAAAYFTDSGNLSVDIDESAVAVPRFVDIDRAVWSKARNRALELRLRPVVTGAALDRVLVRATRDGESLEWPADAEGDSAPCVRLPLAALARAGAGVWRISVAARAGDLERESDPTVAIELPSQRFRVGLRAWMATVESSSASGLVVRLTRAGWTGLRRAATTRI